MDRSYTLIYKLKLNSKHLMMDVVDPDPHPSETTTSDDEYETYPLKAASRQNTIDSSRREAPRDVTPLNVSMDYMSHIQTSPMQRADGCTISPKRTLSRQFPEIQREGKWISPGSGGTRSQRSSTNASYMSKLKPPLLNSSNHSTASTDSDLIIEHDSKNFSGYGKPNEFLTPTGACQKKSWRPKSNSSLSPKRDNTTRSSDPGTYARSLKPPLLSSSNHSTVSPEQNATRDEYELYGRRPYELLTPTVPSQRRCNPSPKSILQHRSPHQTLSSRSDHSVVYQACSSCRTPENDQGSKKFTIDFDFLPLVAPPLHLEEAGTRIPHVAEEKGVRYKRSSGRVSQWTGRTASSLSPVPSHKTSRKVDCLDDVPPAFQAALRSTARNVPNSSRNKFTRQIDPSSLERVKTCPKEKLVPGKLQHDWPPRRCNDPVHQNKLSFLRTYGMISDTRVKERRRAFESDPSLMSTTLTTVDVALRLIHDKQLLCTNDTSRGKCLEDPSRLTQRVHEILNSCVSDTIASDYSFEADADTETTPLTCGDILSKLQIQTSLKVRWGGPTYRTIEGRPLYFDGSYTDESGKEVPFAPLLEDRFGTCSRDSALGTPIRSRDANDLPPSFCRRSYDDWSDDESCDSTSDDPSTMNDDHSTRDEIKRHHVPSVWVAPLGYHKDASPIVQGIWRMKRVWDDPEIDMKEPIYRVQEDHLMEKVKELLGVPIDWSSSNHVTDEDYDPEADMWCMKKFYDIDGEIQEVSETMRLNERRLSMSFIEVTDIMESNGQIGLRTDCDRTSHSEMELLHLLNTNGTCTCTKSTPSTSGTETSEQPQCQPPSSSSVAVVTAQVANTEVGHKESGGETPKVKQLGKRDGRNRISKKDATIWDLLSPPPVSFVLDD